MTCDFTYSEESSEALVVDRIVFRVVSEDGSDEMIAKAISLSLSGRPRVEIVCMERTRALICSSRGLDLERVLQNTSSIR